MPDHVHVVLEIGRGASLAEVVGAWKSLCYLARSRRGHPEGFWQRSFYDHGIRTAESLRINARYVLNSPVRAGLVEEAREYPFCGSLEFDPW
jgi:REP element-mobilizing transposase RayT